MKLLLLVSLIFLSVYAAPKSVGSGGDVTGEATTTAATSATSTNKLTTTSSSTSSNKVTSSTSSTKAASSTTTGASSSTTSTKASTTVAATAATTSSTSTALAASQLASITNAVTGTVYTGTYTATFSNQVNIGLGGPAFITGFYAINHNVVRVAGSAGIAATAGNTLSSFDMTLPIAMANPSTGFIPGACLIEDTADFLAWEGLINPQTSTRVRVYFTPSTNFIIGNVNWDLTYAI